MDSQDLGSRSMEMDQMFIDKQFQEYQPDDLEMEYGEIFPLVKQPTLPKGMFIDLPENLGTSDSIKQRYKSSEQIDLNQSIIEGYIQKYSPSMMKGWQKRYVILNDKRLYYKKRKEQPYPNGVVNFDHFQCFILSHAKDPLQFIIKIDGLDREFKFKCDNKVLSEKWQNAINTEINNSQGTLEKKSAQRLKKPWRFDNISENQFKRAADTGDLLLFHSNQKVAKITRGYTKSHFDHVAMLLKFEADPGEIYLLEATGNAGVSLNKWVYLRDHIGKGKFYDKVVFRHIEFDRGDEMIENLQKFLSQAVGNKYGLNANKLTRNSSVIMDDLGVDQNGDQRLIAADRTFFCSELVAKAFKILGIIEDDTKSSSKYFPGHFTTKNQGLLKLTKDTKIETELMIIMDREDLEHTSDFDSLPND